MGANGCRCSSVKASLLCSHKSALPWQSQGVHPQLFCVRCTTKEQKTATDNRQQGFFQLGEDYDQRLYKDLKWQGHSRFFRPYMKYCLTVLLHTFFVGYILRAKRAKTNSCHRCVANSTIGNVIWKLSCLV